MIVRCSQCGAKINRKDENRFFRCPFCASSLVLEGGRSFVCFIMEHERNDLWARARFHERLTRAGVGAAHGTVAVDLSYIPFWVIRRHDGSVTAHPAVETSHQGLSSIKVPPGRLIFYEEGSRPEIPVIIPSIPLNRVLGEEIDGSLGRVDLIYLPVYCLRSAGADGRYSFSLVADSSRLYSGTDLVERRDISVRPLAFFAGAACLFVAVGLLVGDVYVRAAAIAACGLALIFVFPLVIGPKR